jgi:hypothetical protein
MMKPFKWRVALCDDNPQDKSVSGTKTLLESAGFTVLLISTPGDFRTHADKLSRCHLALIDMDWGAVFSEEKAPEAIPSDVFLNSQGLSAFVNKWISALESWGHANATIPINWAGWPRTRIGSKETGAWLGALLSNIAPGIEIIFYSGKPGVASSGFAAALGRFRDAAYAVETKTESAPLSLEAIGRHLVKLQLKALGQSDIYDWFLADILLPTLLSAETAPRNLYEPAIHDARSGLEVFRMEKDSFFPILASGSNLTESLPNYLRTGAFRALSLDRLSDLEHDLRPWEYTRFLNDPVRLSGQLIQLSQKVISTSPKAVGIASGLWSAIEALRTGNADAQASCEASIRRAWELAWATLFEPNCAFQRIAVAFGGTYIATKNTEVDYPTDNPTAKARRKKIAKEDRKMARIDLQGLERACTHLKANGVGTLKIEEDEDVLRITWIGTWTDHQDTFECFMAKVRESLREPLGAHRGLPSVILFGLENDAESMRVAVGGAWHTLFPIGYDTNNESEHVREYHFEWKFKKE